MEAGEGGPDLPLTSASSDMIRSDPTASVARCRVRALSSLLKRRFAGLGLWEACTAGAEEGVPLCALCLPSVPPLPFMYPLCVHDAGTLERKQGRQSFLQNHVHVTVIIFEIFVWRWKILLGGQSGGCVHGPGPVAPKPLGRRPTRPVTAHPSCPRSEHGKGRRHGGSPQEVMWSLNMPTPSPTHAYRAPHKGRIVRGRTGGVRRVHSGDSATEVWTARPAASLGRGIEVRNLPQFFNEASIQNFHFSPRGNFFPSLPPPVTRRTVRVRVLICPACHLCGRTLFCFCVPKMSCTDTDQRHSMNDNSRHVAFMAHCNGDVEGRLD